MFSERDLRTGEVYPHPTLVPFSGLRRQGNIILGYVHQNHADPTYLIDLNQLTLSEYEKRKLENSKTRSLSNRSKRY